MLFEVQRNAFEELLLTNELRQHAKYYRRLSDAFLELTNTEGLAHRKQLWSMTTSRKSVRSDPHQEPRPRSDVKIALRLDEVRLYGDC